MYIRGQNGVSTFDDSKSYYREDAANRVHYGVKVLTEDGTSMKIRIS